MHVDEWIVRALLTIGGFGVGLVTAWANGALGEMGSHWAKERREHKRRRSEERAAAQKKTRQGFMAGLARFNAGQKRKQLEGERIMRKNPDPRGWVEWEEIAQK